MRSPFKIGSLPERHLNALYEPAMPDSFTLLAPMSLIAIAVGLLSSEVIADTLQNGTMPTVETAADTQTWTQNYFFLIIILGLAVVFYALTAIYRRIKGIPAAANEETHLHALPLLNAETMAHATLDARITALRESLYKYGAPYREGDCLYFGNFRVNGDHEIVDQIKKRFDCYATIFLKDIRIATNILLEDGSRALNTPLAPGPAYDAVLLHGKSFSGEATLFGQPILGLYEPIFNGHEVIGMLFVGA